VWRAQAENLADSLTRGLRVIVTGRLKSRSWTTEAGEKRTVFDVQIDAMGPSLLYATAKVTKAIRSTNTDSARCRDPRRECAFRFTETMSGTRAHGTLRAERAAAGPPERSPTIGSTSCSPPCCAQLRMSLAGSLFALRTVERPWQHMAWLSGRQRGFESVGSTMCGQLKRSVALHNGSRRVMTSS
jgi:hypothetical protein